MVTEISPKQRYIIYSYIKYNNQLDANIHVAKCSSTIFVFFCSVFYSVIKSEHFTPYMMLHFHIYNWDQDSESKNVNTYVIHVNLRFYIAHLFFKTIIQCNHYMNKA